MNKRILIACAAVLASRFRDIVDIVKVHAQRVLSACGAWDASVPEPHNYCDVTFQSPAMPIMAKLVWKTEYG